MKQVIFLMLALAFALPTGCYNSGSDDGELTMLIAPDQGAGWKAVVKNFHEKYPEIRIKLVEGPAATNERENMYTNSLKANDGVYDLVYMDVIWIPKFASQGWLAPLDEFFPEKDRSDFFHGDIKGSIYDGKIYRVPMQSDAGMLYYRKDLLEKSGLKPPKTFAELAETASKFHKPSENMYGFVFQGKQYEGLVCFFLEVLWGHGGMIFDQNGKISINSQQTVQALRWLGGITRGDERICPAGVTTYQEEEARNVFQEGRALFMRNWPYAWTKAQEKGSKIRGKVGISPMVHSQKGQSAATLGGWGIGITKTCKKKMDAWKFIKFATSEKMQKIFHEKKGVVPSRKSLFKDDKMLEKNPHFKELYQVLLKAKPRPVHVNYSEISDTIQLHVSSVLVGRETPAQAAKAMEKEIKRITGKTEK